MRDGGPVIGRESELREVTRTLLSTGDPARVLLLVGAAGTGKTAVLEHARRAAVEEGARVLRLRCHDGGSTPGAAALADGVHSALAKLHGRRTTVRVSGARRPGRQRVVSYGELSQLSALSEALTEAARDSPFALLLDDVDRLPSATASALGLLIRVFRPAGVPMVMAGRPAHPRDGGASQLTSAADRLLELPPLRPADVEALMVHVLGRPVEPALVTAVLHALGPMAGTPEAVLSVLDSMDGRGGLLELGGHVCLTEPEQALRLTTDLAQLRRLCWPGEPPDTADLDAAAAVARALEHAEIRFDDLHRLKPGGPRRAGLVDRALTPLVGDGILTVDEDGRASFAVPALAAALRALPTHHEVSSLHALITRSLSDRLGAETAGGGHPRLADHVTAAGAELDDALAVDVLLAAARTDARSDWPRSVRAYSSALGRLAPYDRRTPGVLYESAELSLRHADHPGALALGEPLLACLDASPAERDGSEPQDGDRDLDLDRDQDQDRNRLVYVTEVWALASLHEHRLPYTDADADGPGFDSGSGSPNTSVAEHLAAVEGFAALAGPYGIGRVADRPAGEGRRTTFPRSSAGGLDPVRCPRPRNCGCSPPPRADAPNCWRPWAPCRRKPTARAPWTGCGTRPPTRTSPTPWPPYSATGTRGRVTAPPRGTTPWCAPIWRVTGTRLSRPPAGSRHAAGPAARKPPPPSAPARWRPRSTARAGSWGTPGPGWSWFPTAWPTHSSPGRG